MVFRPARWFVAGGWARERPYLQAPSRTGAVRATVIVARRSKFAREIKMFQPSSWVSTKTFQELLGFFNLRHAIDFLCSCGLSQYMLGSSRFKIPAFSLARPRFPVHHGQRLLGWMLCHVGWQQAGCRASRLQEGHVALEGRSKAVWFDMNSLTTSED